MSPARRDPDSCPYLRDGRRGPEAKARPICGLASRVAGIECAVIGEICEACCEHPLPSGARLNPVVASLVFAVSGRALGVGSPRDPVQVEFDQARRFALRWLKNAESVPRDECPAPRVEGPRAPRPPRPGPLRARLGLVGSATYTGLGYQNRDIAIHLGVERWLVLGPSDATCRGLDRSCRVDRLDREPGPNELVAWLEGLDVLLFAGSPMRPGLLDAARRLGVRVVCVPFWEWVHPGDDWLDGVDLMLCPTRYTADRLSGWRDRFGFSWGIECIPWPVDVDRFRFQERRQCLRFVFVTGTGGMRALLQEGGGEIRRKGLEVLIEAARRAPEVRLIVYASPEQLPWPPPNVERRPPPVENTRLYQDGDVCIQPSLWEGIGLPLLECQAAGMPLITTDAPPMREHGPMALIPATLETVQLPGYHPIPAALIHPDDLADTLRSVNGRAITAQSWQARQFIEREHNWNRAGPAILDRLERLVS